MQHSIWLKKTCSPNLIFPRRITASKWPTNNQPHPLHSTSRVKTFAYRRLAQGLGRSLSAFSSFIRKYLDPLIKADQCAQYVDYIGIATNTPLQLIKNLRAVFQCLRKTGLELSMAKCPFGVQQVDFLGRTITTKGVAPQKQKIAKFLENVKLHDSKKHFKDTLDS